MQGIVIQLSRFGFLALLWWFVLRIMYAFHNDMRINTTVITKSRLSEGIPPKPTNHSMKYGSSASYRSQRSLVITAGEQAGTSIPLDSDAILIGRSPDCTVVINDHYSSDHHARLTQAGQQWFLEDLGSINGTFLDKARVGGGTIVPLSTPIRIGKTVMELR